MTLNNVTYRLAAFANSHRMIKHFYIGDIVDWLALGEVVYPACFIEFQTGKISVQDRMTYYGFRIWFCDVEDTATNSQDNQIELYSDLTSIAEDYIAMLWQEAKSNSDFSLINTNFNTQLWNEKFEDLLVAVSIDVTISTKYNANRCQVPATGVTFQSQQAMIIDNYIHQVLTEATSLTLANLKNKKILWFMAGEKLLNPISLDAVAGGYTLTPNDYTYDPATGQFNFGTFIEPPQILQILNRTIQ